MEEEEGQRSLGVKAKETEKEKRSRKPEHQVEFLVLAMRAHEVQNCQHVMVSTRHKYTIKKKILFYKHAWNLEGFVYLIWRTESSPMFSLQTNAMQKSSLSPASPCPHLCHRDEFHPPRWQGSQTSGPAARIHSSFLYLCKIVIPWQNNSNGKALGKCETEK